MAILFHEKFQGYKLKRKNRIRQWIKNSVASEHYYCGDINFVFENDENVYKINKKYLKHDWYTDVISFDYNEKKLVSGDIIISIERVKDNANTYNVKMEEEILRVMIHGILHLCGYEDRTEGEKAVMSEKENHYLGEFFDKS